MDTPNPRASYHDAIEEIAAVRVAGGAAMVSAIFSTTSPATVDTPRSATLLTYDLDTRLELAFTLLVAARSDTSEKMESSQSLRSNFDVRILRVLSLFAGLAVLSQAAFAEDAPPKPERILLWSNNAPVGGGAFQSADATITVHLASHANGAALVICPGGGYGGLVTGAEGHGIAAWLNGHGITGVVLEYRLPKGNAFVPLLDAQRAIRTVRSRAAEWGIDPERIGIIGFSAGGHLASTAGTHFDGGDPKSTDAIERVSCRPDFMVLVYPVISMGASGHQGSRNNLLGGDAKPEMVELFSNEKRITAQTPPAFLAHALDDKVVPADNSKMFYDALQSSGVAAKYLELPEGGHGLNGYKGAMWDAWQAQSLEWLAARKVIPAADLAPQKLPLK